jgi:hypothetical protein
MVPNQECPFNPMGGYEIRGRRKKKKRGEFFTTKTPQNRKLGR